jgi:hypothetical protein
MARVIVDDPGALSRVIADLGGRIIENSWRFDLPLSEVKDVVPRLNKLGVGVREVRQRTEYGPKIQTITTLELYRPAENKPDHIEEWGWVK